MGGKILEWVMEHCVPWITILALAFVVVLPVLLYLDYRATAIAAATGEQT